MKSRAVYLILLLLGFTTIPAFAEQDVYDLVLEHVNSARVDAGLNAVTLEANPAVQYHAEEMLANCYTSLWSIDGLKPYMRYALAGGDQYMSGIVYGPNYCITESDGREPISLESEIIDAVDALLNDTYTSAIIFDPYNAYTSVGIAYDEYNMQLYILFEYDLIDWHTAQIDGNKLTIRGMLYNDAFPNMTLPYASQPFLTLRYDPPSADLTLGQLARTYCYDYGPRVSIVVVRGLPKYYETIPVALSTCSDPYKYPSDVPAATSPEMAYLLKEAARIDSTAYKPYCFVGGGCFLVNATNPANERGYAHSLCKSDGCFLVGAGVRVPAHYVRPNTVTFTEADVLHLLDNGMFNIQADISGVISRHGPGFYTALIYGNADGAFQIFGAYTMPYGIGP